MERRSVADLAGEFLRELGVLVVAFVPLELEGRFSDRVIVGIVIIGAALWAFGVLIERWRD